MKTLLSFKKAPLLAVCLSVLLFAAGCEKIESPKTYKKGQEVCVYGTNAKMVVLFRYGCGEKSCVYSVANKQTGEKESFAESNLMLCK